MSKLDELHIEDYWFIIKYNHEQIRFAEIKASAVISLYSILLTVAYTLDILDDENVYDFTFSNMEILSLITILPGIYFTFMSIKGCISCILPRLNIAVEKSPLFFGDFDKYSDFKDYSNALDEMMDDEEIYKKHLSQSVYSTGKIAALKFQNVNKSIKSLLMSIAFYAVFLVSLYLI